MTTIHRPADTQLDPAEVARLTALSDERDRWLTRLLGAERAAYDRGFADGRATACVALAVMEDQYQAVAHWREYAATVRRITRNNDDPSARMSQVMAEIAADQKFVADARARLASRPWTLSPMELIVVRRIRLIDPGDNRREAA